MKSPAREALQIPVMRHVITRLRGLAQEYRIRAGERRCEHAVHSSGTDIGREPYAQTYLRLQERLHARGIAWPPEPSGRPLHILYASFPTNWDAHNIPLQLQRLGNASCYFVRERGFRSMDRVSMRAFIDCDFPAFVADLHRRQPVDLLLSYFSGAEISPVTIERIKALGIATFAFHWDDRPSFYGRQLNGQWTGPAAVCRHYDLNLTNAPESLLKYRLAGALAAFWPEAANPEFFRPLNLPFRYDVSFIGQRYGIRERFIQHLRRNGIAVAAFGPGWEGGELTEEEMVNVYNSSRINLGFGYILDTTNQICLKGRDFEVPACGAVYLTTHSAPLEAVYTVGREVVTYTGMDDCLAHVRQLLADTERCAAIRTAARAAVLGRHTWVHRMKQVLFGTPALRTDTNCIARLNPADTELCPILEGTQHAGQQGTVRLPCDHPGASGTSQPQSPQGGSRR